MDRNYECPICYKTLLPPVYQCHHGHLLCNLCEGQVDQCPICRVQLCPQKIRNLAVEGIIKEIGFSCENRSLGCSQAHLPWDQVENHYIDCPFTRKLYCKSLGLNCDEEHDSRGIIPHITLVHKFKGRINNLDLDLDCDKGLEIGSSQSQSSIEDVNNEFGHGSGGLSTTTLESTYNTTMTPTTTAPAPTMNSHLDIHYQCKVAELDKYLRHCTNVFFIKFQSKLFFVKKHFNLNSKTLSFLILLDGSQAAADQFSVTVNIHPEHSKTPSLEWHQQIYLLSSGLNLVDNNRTLDETSFADSQNQQNQIKIKIPTMLIEQIGKVKQTGTGCSATLNWKIKFVFTKLKTQQNSGCSPDHLAAAGLTKNPKLSKHNKKITTTTTTETETLPNQMSRSRRLFRSNLDHQGHQGHQDGNNNMTLSGSMDQGQQRYGPGHNTQTPQNHSHNNYFSGTSSTFSTLISWVRERILANRI